MGLVEQSVRTLKEILKKHGNNLSQLQLSELVFAINSRTQGEQGLALTRFLGRGVRGNSPNSLERDINWQEQVAARGDIRQKSVEKRGRTNRGEERSVFYRRKSQTSEFENQTVEK